MSQSPSWFDVLSVNGVQPCDCDVTISRRSFVFVVSAGFTNVSSLAVATFDLVYCSLGLSSGLYLSLTLVSSHHKVVISLGATRILQGSSIHVIVLEVPLMYGIVTVVTGPELILVSVLESVLPWVVCLTKSSCSCSY